MATIVGQRWRGMDNSSARKGKGAPMGFRQCEAAAEMTHAAAAWLGGGPSGVACSRLRRRSSGEQWRRGGTEGARERNR